MRRQRISFSVVAAAAALALTVGSALAQSGGQEQERSDRQGWQSRVEDSQVQSEERASLSGQREGEDRASMGVRPPVAQVPEALAERLQAATDVYTTFIERSEVPRRIKDEAGCVAVLPNVRRTALVVGRVSGDGVATCRTSGGQWSVPAFVELSGTSLGIQAGSETSDLILYAVGDQVVEKVKGGERLTFGSNVSAIAGPVGGERQLTLEDGIYAYARNAQGLFAGVALDGSRLRPDEEANNEAYGEERDIGEILEMSQVETLPPVAEQFVQAVEQSMQSTRQA